MKTSILLVYLSLITYCQGQTSQVFKEKPSDLTSLFSSASDMTDKILSTHSYEIRRSEGILVRDVITNSSFFTQFIHKSGNVIFNSEAGDYLNEIKNLLLEGYPKLQNNIHIYVTRDASLNAFATANNNIYVNIGLLAAIENEAQLAFVLSHEIMHIVNNHVVNEEIELHREKSIFTKKDLLLNNEISEFTRHSISRKNETQADVDGIELFMRFYSANEATLALELLKEEDNAETTPIDHNYIFTELAEFDAIKAILVDYQSKEMKSTDTLLENQLSTHPLIKDRILKLNSIIAKHQPTGETMSNYLVSETRFSLIKEAATLMIPDLYLDNFNYFELLLLSVKEYNSTKIKTSKNLERLAFSIQGLSVNKLQNLETPTTILNSTVDSLLFCLVNYAPKKQFYQWCLGTLSKLNSADSVNSKVNSVTMALKENLLKYEPEIAKELLDDELASIAIKPSKSLKLEDIDFEISGETDFTAKEIKKFNIYKKEAGRIGKIAILNIANHKMILKGALFGSYKVLNYPEDDEELNNRSIKSSLNLEIDFPDKILSIVPNSEDYSAEDYEMYTTLNRLLDWNFYYNSFSYVSPYKDLIDSISSQTQLTHYLTSINIEVRGFSTKKGSILWLSMIPMPHFIPQLAANLVLGSTRKYKLTLIYDIKNGQLEFWEKQTSLEPSTVSVFYTYYKDIIQKFSKL